MYLTRGPLRHNLLTPGWETLLHETAVTCIHLTHISHLHHIGCVCVCVCVCVCMCKRIFEPPCIILSILSSTSSVSPPLGSSDIFPRSYKVTRETTVNLYFILLIFTWLFLSMCQPFSNSQQLDPAGKYHHYHDQADRTDEAGQLK
jgi:hypothetical protein